MQGLWMYDLMMAAAVAVALLGHSEFSATHELIDAEVTAAVEREVSERKADVKPEDRVALTHPLQYDATVTMGAGRTRFYVRGEGK